MAQNPHRIRFDTLGSVQEMENCFLPETFGRGISYARQGRVLECSISGTEILGKVKGSNGKIYTQTIDFFGASGSFIENRCTCPVRYDCKHVVAVLHTYFEQKKAGKVLPPIRARTQPTANLSHNVLSWIQTLESCPDPQENARKPSRDQKLYFVLYPLRENTPKWCIGAGSITTLKSGKVQAFKPLNIRVFKIGGPHPAYLSEFDIRMMTRLHHITSMNTQRNWHYDTTYNPEHDVILEGYPGADLLELLLEAGRLHWKTWDGPLISVGAPKTCDFSWRITDDALYALTPQIGTDTEAHCEIIPTDPPYYLDPQTHTIGPVDFKEKRSVPALLNAPKLTLDEAEILRRQMPDIAARKALPPIPHIEKIQKKNVTPTPCLRFSAEEQNPWHVGTFYSLDAKGHKKPSLYKRANDIYPTLSLHFDYDGARAFPMEKEPSVRKIDRNQIVDIDRDPRAESKILKSLLNLGFVPARNDLEIWKKRLLGTMIPAIPITQDGIDPEDVDYHWARIMTEIAALRSKGWKIEISDDFPIHHIDVTGEWRIDISEGSGIDWFNFSISSDDPALQAENFKLMPILLSIARNIDKEWLNQDFENSDGSIVLKFDEEDTRFLTVPAKRLQGILLFLKDLWGMGRINETNETLELSRLDAALLADMEAASHAAHVRWFGGESLRELGQKLRDFKGITPVPPPASLTADLRPYQQEGLNWLCFLSEYGLGGILADDMGLGKTIQALSWIAHEKESGRMHQPVLVIAPTSLMHNWRQEAQKFTPSLKVLTLQGTDRKAHFESIPAHDLILSTYPLLPRDKDFLTPHGYHAVILDEAQFLKNSKARMTQIVQHFQAQHRLCLTGTPMENHLGELWSLFHFLQPGFLGDEKLFAAQYRRPIEKLGDESRRDSLVRRIRPFLLRRTKEQVATELPPKTELLRTVDMDTAQRDLYETIRLSMHEKVRREIASKGLGRSHIVLLDALLKLRQVCCDPRLLPVQSAKSGKAGSAKLDMLMEMLPPMVEEGRRILLFSQFTKMLALIEECCAREKIPYVQLTGQTKDRTTPVDSFQNGKVPLFLISLKAGGTGLNLTTADTVIHYDPWWNPAVERQATDRAHRIGQDKSVFVYKLITAGTVEEKIMEMQAQKQALADSLFDPQKSSTTKLTEKDIAALFEPIA